MRCRKSEIVLARKLEQTATESRTQPENNRQKTGSNPAVSGMFKPALSEFRLLRPALLLNRN
jgi:hypothetical protein